MATPENPPDLQAFLDAVDAECSTGIGPDWDGFNMKTAARKKRRPKISTRTKRAITVKIETGRKRRKRESRIRSAFRSVATFAQSFRGSGSPTSVIVAAGLGELGKSMSKFGASEDAYTFADLVKAAGVEGYSIWEDEDGHPILMYRDLTRYFGKDWLNWEPETLWQALEEDEKISELSRVTKDKISALRVAIKTDFPWTQLEVFENVALAFNGKEARFDVMQMVEPFEVAFAIDVLVYLHPGIEMGERVQSYIAATLFDNGLSYAPPALFGPVQDDLDLLRRGTNLVRDGVKKAWAEKLELDEEEIGKDPVQTQLATLHAIRDFLKQRRQELELTPPLPELEYDVQGDDAIPRSVPDALSGPARGEWLRRPSASD